ncbi:GTPase [Corynebacterium guangdongense]|uniref:GTP-binding protein EngB required for normal cell division n=1 Tax=Corynebacterium guangdongense TaxID=1783348 RepID=A0ABU1ZX79_9CORY|nr:GTPase [Corynebacterium guangdongense]MDR7328518.1 GTP-binding protein EngB required for normal cell division [Corynebacterium guangdongense]WJZ17095.1 GTPase Era [Corynebacterium guangdongense]
MRLRKATLPERLEALAAAADLAEGILPGHRLAELRRVAASATERRELSDTHTVVGFFGATGSGKTSLFNAVVGEDLGLAAARRPTTSSPLAAVWHPDGSAALLDWLGVEDRRPREGDFSPKAGPLILLDLPDFDSVEAANRVIAEKLAGQVDVLVWVTDPEKYADAVIHDEFIRPHARHAAVTLAVLNKSDRLAPEEVVDVTHHLGQLLHDDGLSGVKVVATSAATGAGIEALRGAISKVAAGRQAAQARIEADIEAVTADLLDAPATRDAPRDAKKQLDEALARAAGAEGVAEVTAAAYRRRLGRRTGWLLTSWIGRLRADPLRRLGLTEAADETGVHHSSRPAISASATAVANKAVRTYAERLGSDLPPAWGEVLSERAEAVAVEVPELLDRAVARTTLPAEPSRAWSVVTVIQWLALLGALVGVGWYLVAAFLPGALAPLLGDDIIPETHGWPIPTLLILGGLLLGLVLGMVTGVFGGLIGASVKRRTRRGVRRHVAEESARHVERPLLEVRERHAQFREAASLAYGRR